MAWSSSPTRSRAPVRRAPSSSSRTRRGCQPMLSREYPKLYYDGAWQEPDSKERFDIINPATEEKIGFVPAANETDIDRAVESARKAFYETDWPTRPVGER